jgi:putative isomerase
LLEALKAEAARLGKQAWQPMLQYVAELHERSTHPPRPPFAYPWEEIGPGYQASPAFGHWDIIHQVFDTLPSEPEHARNQILNNLANQEPDGLVPGSIWLRGPEPRWSKTVGHPLVWPVAVDAYCSLTGCNKLIGQCYEPLLRQLNWFETNRRAEEGGFFYLDITHRSWESGVDEGVRFDDAPAGPYTCVDATSHLYQAYATAARWAEILGRDAHPHQQKADVLRELIQNRLFDEETGFFHDMWAVGQPQMRRMALEGMFPMVMGAATPEQAQRVIDENLLNTERFFAAHPVSSVSTGDPRFELRMWRGPTWNSMTYWAALGCMRYGRADAAGAILAAALDASVVQFEKTGTIWEFYHPQGGNPRDLQRKPQTSQNTPCPDYLGHNPLLAMARLWQKVSH